MEIYVTLIGNLARSGVSAPSGELMEVKIFDRAELLPVHIEMSQQPRVFNPTILVWERGYIVFYRIVSESIGRRIGACRLDQELNVVPGSVIDFSQAIASVPGWHSDPRLFLLGGEVWVSWNNGFVADGDNDQYIVRIEPDTLAPIGSPTKIGAHFPRRRTEKNWMFFSDEGKIRAVYSIAPHRIIEEETPQHWRFVDRFSTLWNASRVERQFGEPRGGAQPVRLGDFYYHFCHGSRRIDGKLLYVGLVYEFSAEAPYRVTRFCEEQLPLPNPNGEAFDMPRLNDQVSSVVYPTGAVILAAASGPEWLISYGINDEACGIAKLSHEKLDAMLKPVASLNKVTWWIDLVSRKLVNLPGRLARRLLR